MSDRSLQQTATLDSINGASWLSIGLILGFLGGIFGATIFNYTRKCLRKSKAYRAPSAQLQLQPGLPTGTGVQHVRQSAQDQAQAGTSWPQQKDSSRSNMQTKAAGAPLNSVMINVQTEDAPQEYMNPSLPATNPRVHQAAYVAATQPAQPMSVNAHPNADTRHSHTRTRSGLDMKESYMDGDLDDDWQALLGELDDLLVKQGAERMSAQERGTAVKKLIESTGTRGATFALASARDVVLMTRRRAMHNAPRA